MSLGFWTPYRLRKCIIIMCTGRWEKKNIYNFVVNTIFVKRWANINENQYFSQLKVQFYIIQ